MVARLPTSALNEKLIVEVLVRCHSTHLPRLLEHIHLILLAEVFTVAAHRDATILHEAARAGALELLELCAAELLQVLHVRELVDLVLLGRHWRRLEGRCATRINLLG